MTEQITTKPFASQSQWRFAFGTHQPWAKRWAHETPGGKGMRYRKLPFKVAKKAANYHARAGQTIAGRLRRGASGKFESTGAAPVTSSGRLNAARDAALRGGKQPPKAARGGKRAGRTPAKTEQQRAAEREQKRQQRQAEQDKKRQEAQAAKRAERDKILADAGLGSNSGLAGALIDARDGNTIAPQNGKQLAEMGLAEQARDGSYRLTPAGREVVNAAEAGDAGRVRDTLSRASDRAATGREREAARAERANKPKGGGGGKKAPKLARRTPTRSSHAPRAVQAGRAGGGGGTQRQEPARSPYADIAGKLSAGQTLTADEENTLIRNGLARRNRDGSLSLTYSGQQATTKAIAPTRTTDAGHTGVMVALYPDEAATKAIASADGVTEPPDALHLTLCFLGDSTEQPLMTNKDRLIEAVGEWARQHGQPLKGVVNGLGRFFHSESDGTNAVYVSPDAPGLPELRQSLAQWIEKSGFDYSHDHGFTPHITVAYVPEDAPTPPIRVETPVQFDRATLAWGDEQYDFPMGMRGKAMYEQAIGHWGGNDWVSHKAPGTPGDYLVVEDRTKPSTWHLQVKRGGKADHRLMGAAWAALHGGYRGSKYAGPGKTEALAKLKRLYASEGMDVPAEKAISEHVHEKVNAVHKKMNTFSVYKDARGQWRWVAYSSNAYKDRDQEIVSTKALENDCARADSDGQYGPLRWWHVGGVASPGWDLGVCDFNAMHGRVLIESGTFKSVAIGAAVARAAPHLQLSIGFTHAPDEPDAQGVFHHIRRFERSLVPTGRAANPFTKLVVKETHMDQEKETALKAALGDEAAAQVLAGAEQTQKDADAQGVAYKSEQPDPWAALGATIAQALKTALAPVEPVEPVEPPAEPEPVAEKADDMMMDEEKQGGDMGDGEMPMDNAGGEMSADEFLSAIGDLIDAKLAPLIDALGITQKLDGHFGELKAALGAFSKQKDDADAARAQEIAALKAQIAELQGDVPPAFRDPLIAGFGGYRASQAADTVVTNKAEIPGGPPAPLNGASQPTADDPFADLKFQLFGNGATPTNGRT